MMKALSYFLMIVVYCLTPIAIAQESTPTSDKPPLEKSLKSQENIASKQDLQVGKHVPNNMENATSMILSLLMVLGLIIISALVLKRFNINQQNTSQLKVIASLPLGPKERVIVVQVGEEQLVLGVCPQQISLLKNLDKALDVQTDKPLALSGSVLSFIQKNNSQATSSTHVANNETTNSK